MRFWDEALAETAQREPHTPAFVDATKGLSSDVSSMSYSDYDRRADAWSAFLASAGIGRSDVVCLLLENSFELPVCFAGNSRRGAITSAVNVRLGPAEKQGIVERAQPGLTVAEDDADVPADCGLVVRRHELAQAFTADGGGALSDRTLHDDAVIVWTSGTTGVPKGAVFTHAALGALVRTDMGLAQPHDRFLAAVPQAHVGFITKVWAHADRATTQVIAPPRWDPETALGLMAHHGITVAGGIPAQWRMMLDSPAFETTDLSAVRQAIVGGASVEAGLVREIRERVGAPVVVRYTCTELAGTCGTVPGDPDEVVANTVGRPLAGVEVALVSETGAPTVDGDVGEVVSRSPAMMSRYWGDPDLTRASVDAEGWFHTGDLGRWRPDANLQIVGRLKDMYIRGGYNVYPAEVENRLAAHPGISAVAVVGAPDPRLGEVGVACVVASDPTAPPALDDLRAWVAADLADYKRPDRLVILDALPLTSLHKPDKVALGALVAGS